MKKQIIYCSLFVALSSAISAFDGFAEEAVIHEKVSEMTSKRDKNSVGLALNGYLLGFRFIMPEVRLSYFPIEGLATDISFATRSIVDRYSVGVQKYFAPKSPLSLYGFLRGSYIDAGKWEIFGFELDMRTPAIGAGPGIQYVHESGLALNAEAGGELFTKTGKVRGQGTFGVSWLF